MNAQQRVTALRTLMREHGFDAYIVPTEDAHMSEYVAACDERRSFLTSFTGSAGTALVTHEAAFLWTDGRYFVQAAKQLDPDVFQLMRVHEDPPLEDWIVSNMSNLSVVAIDARTVSVSSVKRMRAAFATRAITLVPTPHNSPNLVDIIWGSARPALPAAPVRVHPIKYAGLDVKSKLAAVRSRMKDLHQPAGVDFLIVAGLDEVAWLLNLRGSDVDYNPVFWSYVVVTPDRAVLFTNSTRFLPDIEQHLAESGVDVRPYDAIYADLATMINEKANDGNTNAQQNAKSDAPDVTMATENTAVNSKNSRSNADDAAPKTCVWLDPSASNYGLLDTIEKAAPSVRVIQKQSPVMLAKARKNKTELEGMRQCHIRDAVAMCKYLAWLERTVVHEKCEVDEVDVAAQLDRYREEQELHISPSFPTISSSGANGAIIHYKPEKPTCARVALNTIYLVDSGGQYMDGTTDVTRTVHLGEEEPSSWERECFTRVLQGHIAVDSAVFPKGTTGHLLDGFARKALWDVGLDYKHGTGHGVGSCLNVHEGPHMISFRAQALETALEAGFMTSNEPGYYEEGNFGIRIENLCIIKEAKVKGPPGGAERTFLGMEHVTLVPLQKKLIDVDLLTRAEWRWIDAYHEEVWEKLNGRLEDDEETLKWLRQSTAPLD